MKTIAAIKNELFQDYVKVVSTDNLEQTLDNPNVPVPFICVAAVQNPNSDKLAAEINKFFEHKKLKNKDFLAMDASDLTQLNFMFNLVQLSTTGESTVVTAPVATPTVAQVVAEVVAEVAPVAEVKPAKVKEAPVAEVVVEVAPVVEEKVEAAVETQVEVEVESTPVEVAVETVVEVASVAEEVEAVAVTPEAGEMIESLNIPKNATIHFAKNAEVTATIVDEKTVVFDGEELPIVDATKKAFKKAGTTGMALGLANWNYEGTSLKALKDKN